MLDKVWKLFQFELHTLTLSHTTALMHVLHQTCSNLKSKQKVVAKIHVTNVEHIQDCIKSTELISQNRYI